MLFGSRPAINGAATTQRAVNPAIEPVFFTPKYSDQNREKSSTTGKLIGQVNPMIPEVSKRILNVPRLTSSVKITANAKPPQ
jgi:hypothetical protein